MTFPAPEEDAYSDWTAPEHQCYFIEDTGVQLGIRIDGQMVIHTLKRCNQCEETKAIPTDRPYEPVK